MDFVFECNAYNELDHHTPVAAELLKLGNSVTFLLGSDGNLANDPRIEYLQNWPTFRILYLHDLLTPNGRRIFRLLSRLFFGRVLHNKSNSFRLGGLVRFSTALGIFRHHQALNMDCAVSGWGDPSSVLMTSALARNRPIVALPHGYPCLKNFDYNSHIKNIISETGKLPDFSLRNEFNAYVIATQRNRIMLVAWSMSESTLKVWGNARFSPQWVDTLRSILPPVRIPLEDDSIQKVLILLPATTSGFKNGALESLIHRLAQLNIFLILKPHTRDTDTSALTSNWHDRQSNVYVATTEHTTKLIEYSDTVLNFATGTAIEALLLGKRLIFCRYLTDNQLSWDDCLGIQITHTEDAVIGMVEDRSWQSNATEASSYLEQEIFADATVGNPPRRYADELVEIASGSKR